MGDETPSKFKRICVFCGSNSGNRTVFSDAALDLGRELVKRGINLVYGGGSVGLMGLISQTVHDGGCHVLGVIPKALVPIEISGETVGDVNIVSDMHERKAYSHIQVLIKSCLYMLGGYGTMEEVMEMITWSQLGIHDKPVGLLNVDGYYNSLLDLFDNGVEEGFIKPACRHIVISASTASELLAKMELYTPLHKEVAPKKSWEIAHLGQIHIHFTVGKIISGNKLILHLHCYQMHMEFTEGKALLMILGKKSGEGVPDKLGLMIMHVLGAPVVVARHGVLVRIGLKEIIMGAKKRDDKLQWHSSIWMWPIASGQIRVHGPSIQSTKAFLGAKSKSVSGGDEDDRSLPIQVIFFPYFEALNFYPLRRGWQAV
ncbi:hypothetical protein Cni_G11739 [Canna indica]|uniref:cytokinin riboside 5'-monophosphate phosphoribohydrolase n=1 Tax=Canna indica TaxID=4628 RepID=A0AAQ3K8A2_9LILI|nr:hypothetical protein Cni_G11739 [Canna indica]